MMKKRMTRKTAVAVAVLGATLILPGSAVAEHNPGNHRDPYSCDQSIPGDCPAFEASGIVKVQNPVKATPSAVSLEFSQPDRRMPAVRADYYLPNGWRFNGLNEIDPAMQSDGVTPATSCDQVHNSSGSLGNAELLSADTGMEIQVDVNRFDDPSNDEEVLDAVLGQPANDPPAQYGYRRTDPIQGNPARFPSVSFLNWDGTTASFCYHHRNNQNTSVKGSLPATFIGSGTLTRLSGDPDFDWRVSIDLAHVYNHAEAQNEKANIVRHTISFHSFTGANWDRQPGTNERVPMPFSTTPSTADQYPFRTELFACAQAMDSTNATGCQGGAFTPAKVIDQIVHIAPSPDKVRHEFAKLTGPATAGLCTNAFCPLGLVLGQTGFTATWNQPPQPDGVEVMGYAVTLARPGDQASRKFYRLITNPAAPGGQTSAACGAAGDEPSCALDISFPTQSTDGSTTLTNTGKYHLALVTIYMKDGRRTDGLCDGGFADTGEGATCPGGVAPLRQEQNNLQEPGISEWQVLMRPDEWPLVYVVPTDDGSNSTYDPETNTLLLLDYAKKTAELIIWNTNDVETSFASTSNLIVGDNANGLGVFELGTATSAGATQNWALTGFTDPFCGCAWGVFLGWDLKNPGLNPPTISGYPSVDPLIFQMGAL